MIDRALLTSDFDYHLPAELIAQTPIEPRDRSRLMVVDRKTGSLNHRHFTDIPDYFNAGDVLVFNNSRVIPARLSGQKIDSGGRLEILLLHRIKPNVWETLVRHGKRCKTGTRIEIINGSSEVEREITGITAEVIEEGKGGTRILKFSDETLLPESGQTPLPSYIHTPLNNPDRYQTVYAETNGSVAAPTAGLHFTNELINSLKSKGILCLFVTLHIGLDTFRPVREENPHEHPIHREYGVLSQQVANELSRAKVEGRRIICVGTTTVRLVEAVTQQSSDKQIQPFADWVDLFILPGYRFQMVDALITNLHLPKSTLLMLVSAFAGQKLVKKAYQEAITRRYRFYSFGDAMLIL